MTAKSGQRTQFLDSEIGSADLYRDSDLHLQKNYVHSVSKLKLYLLNFQAVGLLIIEILQYYTCFFNRFASPISRRSELPLLLPELICHRDDYKDFVWTLLYKI